MLGLLLVKSCLFSSLRVNSLLDDKILTFSKQKALADDNFCETQMIQFFFDRVVNIVGKGENADYQHFLLFPECFLMDYFSGSWKPGIVWKRVNALP